MLQFNITQFFATSFSYLNDDFSNLCEWFLDNKLCIHFGEAKTKSILFETKQKLRKAGKLKPTKV